ncbi:uncharacterized protein [Eurosta solidaginis]|uniref:uncharacterized protein n=1 Tax=Eurosta solidaginis TaxID=178769 RepID=UPI0035308E33
MRTKRGDTIRNFYELDSNGKNECKICHRILSSDHLGNLKSHLLRKHREEYNENNTYVEIKTLQEDVKYKIILTMSRNEVRKLCSDLVAECGLALQVFSSSPMQKVLAPICQQVGLNNINRNNIHNVLLKQVHNEIDSLKTLLKNRIFSIKIDSAKRFYRNVVCINAQLIDKGEIVIKTPSVTNFIERHTAENLKQIIMETLEKYDISIEQIYSITSDNGQNMIKCGKLLQNEVEYVDSKVEYVDSKFDNEEDGVEDLDSIPCDNIFDDPIFDDCMTTHFNSLSVIRCAAHTVQLCVQDVLNHKDVKPKYEDCRTIAKKLRTQGLHRVLVEHNLPLPSAECPTRWSYSYEMVNHLKVLQEFIKNNIAKSIIDWDFVDDFLQSFYVMKVITEQLQKHNLLFGDFIKFFLETCLAVKKASTHSDISKLLFISINERKNKLLANPTVAAAIYLDPRLHRLLQISEFVHMRGVAIDHLKALHLKVTSLTQAVQDNSFTMASEDDTDLLTELLNQTTAPTFNDSCILEGYSAIESFNESTDTKLNLAAFWERMKYTYKHLYRLSQIIHATPATQVSVERAFSAFKYIVNDYRSNLGDELTETILLLRLNNK